MKNSSLLYLVLMIIAFSGCVIKQEIHFNEDFSGTYKFIFDYSQLNEAMPSDSTQGENEEMVNSFNETVEELEKIQGIANLKINDDQEKGFIELSYDFKDIETLNNSLKRTSSMDLQQNDGANSIQIIKKGSKIKVIQPKSDFEEDSTTQAMNEMFEYEFKISFDKGIKKAKLNNQAKLVNGEIVQKGKLYDLYAKATKWTIKLNK